MNEALFVIAILIAILMLLALFVGVAREPTWKWLENGELEVTLRNGKVYRGSVTVWHEYPSGKRCGHLQESELTEVWKQAVWERDT